MPPARCCATQAMETGDEIVLRRTLAADGRSRAFINDEAVGVGLLKDLGGLLLEVHGQQDDRGLFDTATHRALLDGFGGLERRCPDRGGAVWRTGGCARRAGGVEGAGRRAPRPRPISSAPPPGTARFRSASGRGRKAGRRARPDDECGADRRRSVVGAGSRCRASAAPKPAWPQALKKLSRMNAEARKIAAPAETALEQAYALAEEARRELDRCCRGWTAIPVRWNSKEERLFALRALARKYGVPPDQLPRAARRVSPPSRRR